MNINNLNKMIDEKYISVQKHSIVDLFIYNYTQKAQFDKIWNEETLMCRGLIMDKDNNIVARPFPKFFNVEEAINNGEQLPLEDFRVTEKLDGSLGIMYWVGDTPYIATRGSFVSEQAIVANKILRKKYNDVLLDKDFTYLFEIIYPSNRIVVDYGDREDLILLAVVHTETGDEVNVKNYDDMFPIVATYDGIKDVQELKTMQEDNKEGFVIQYESNKRYKIKFDEYVRLHRLVTGVNARSIWDLLRNEQPFDELMDKVPDEFYDWVKNTKEELEASYTKLEDKAIELYNNVKNYPTRKDMALQLMPHVERGIVFNMLDKKDYKEIIWKMLRPSAEKPFKQDEN
jgi:RNA ligase